MSTGALKRLSWSEYLNQERLAETKSEFVDGEVISRESASRWHNVITVNLASELQSHLDATPCEVYLCDMRVRCPNGFGGYPDVIVACHPEFEDDREDTLLNPLFIVEVLAPSTESYDRGVKSRSYRTLASLKEYMLVGQDQLMIEHCGRQPGSDRWLLTWYDNSNTQLELPALGVTLSIAEIYARVEFPDTQAERPSASDGAVVAAGYCPLQSGG